MLNLNSLDLRHEWTNDSCWSSACKSSLNQRSDVCVTTVVSFDNRLYDVTRADDVTPEVVAVDTGALFSQSVGELALMSPADNSCRPSVVRSCVLRNVHTTCFATCMPTVRTYVRPSGPDRVLSFAAATTRCSGAIGRPLTVVLRRRSQQKSLKDSPPCSQLNAVAASASLINAESWDVGTKNTAERKHCFVKYALLGHCETGLESNSAPQYHDSDFIRPNFKTESRMPCNRMGR